MATKLPKCDLPKLLPWLQDNLPSSFKLYHELRSHLRGKSPDLDLYVDRWPDPQAAAAVVDPAGEQLKGLEFYTNKVRAMFGVTEQAVAVVLRDDRVADWSKFVLVCGIPRQCCPMAFAVVKERNSYYHTIPSYLLKATKEDLQYLPVPDGVKISAISEEDVDVVNSTWKFSGAATADFIRNQIMHSPSVILKSDSGEHIGHMLGETSGTIGILYVQPPFRGKGYAKVIISQLAHQYFDMGEDVYVFVEESNPVSLNLHRSLGFKVVPDLQLSWIECYPETK